MQRCLFIFILLLSLLQGKPLTWAKIKRNTDYRKARTALADHLPELAIPRIETLLAKDLSEESRAQLRTLLGEALLRLATSAKDAPLEKKMLARALAELSHPSLADSSEATYWRAHTLKAQGRLSEAADAFALVDSTARKSSAKLSLALLRTALGERESAIATLLPLLHTKDQSLQDTVRLHLASNYLDSSKLEEATEQLAQLNKPSALGEYLTGRIQLAKGERLPAIATFQNLTTINADDEPEISSPLYHASTLALAESLALEQNELEGITSLLNTLNTHPDTPVLEDLFARLNLWQTKENREFLKTQLREQLKTRDAQKAEISPSDSHRIHLLGSILLQSSQKEDIAEALTLLQLVIQQTPQTLKPLQTRTHRILGLHYLKNEQFAPALTHFKEMVKLAPTQAWLAHALDLQARTSFLNKQPKAAAKAFREAEKITSPDLRPNSLINAGLSYLEAGESNHLSPLLKNEHIRATLLLERGLVYNSKRNPAAREPLEKFLAETVDHPRTKEARLALLESAVFAKPQNAELAKQQFELLKFNEKTEVDFAARFALAALIIDFNADLAISFLARNPTHEQSSRIRFELARYQMRQSQDGEAWGNLEALIESDPENPLADTARLLSARAAITTQNFDRALQRYEELIKGKGPFAIDATIEKAQALIDLEEGGQKAIKTLSPLLKQKQKNIADHDLRRVLAIAATAANKDQDYSAALTYYRRLLSLKNLPISWRNQAFYESGRVLENLNELAKALDAYLEVIHSQLDPDQLTETEWEWFDKCGLSAMTLLEKEKRWQAAISIAEKIARSGDRDEAKAAAARAERLRLDHMIMKEKR